MKSSKHHTIKWDTHRLRNSAISGILALGFVLLVAACGAPSGLPAQSVIERFAAAGLSVSDVKSVERTPNIVVPNRYSEHLSFTVPELGDKGGWVFTCATKSNCDIIYQWFDGLKASEGPYFYQSPDGRVVVELDQELPAEVAASYEEVVKGLP